MTDLLGLCRTCPVSFFEAHWETQNSGKRRARPSSLSGFVCCSPVGRGWRLPEIIPPTTVSDLELLSLLVLFWAKGCRWAYSAVIQYRDFSCQSIQVYFRKPTKNRTKETSAINIKKWCESSQLSQKILKVEEVWVGWKDGLKICANEKIIIILLTFLWWEFYAQSLTKNFTAENWYSWKKWNNL